MALLTLFKYLFLQINNMKFYFCVRIITKRFLGINKNTEMEQKKKVVWHLKCLQLN